MNKLLNKINLFRNLSRSRKINRFKKSYDKWLKSGSQLPMPHFGKKMALENYIGLFHPSIFIETGTYTGHMVLSMLDKFENVYSIELDKKLFVKAKEMFKYYKNVEIINGESDKVLFNLLKTINKPCLFWLDAHYSGGQTAKIDLNTPIMNELEHIFNHKLIDNHIILIDDASCFDGTNDYPTIEFLRKYILEKKPNWTFDVKEDIIRIYNMKINKLK